MGKILVDNNTILIPLSLASAKTIFQSLDNSREHLRVWLPFVDNTKSVEDIRKFIRSVLNSTCHKKDEVYEIWHRDTFAGLIGLKEIDLSNKKTEIGYWLDAGMLSRGIMLYACKSLIDHVIENYQMNRIMIKVATNNYRSRRIPEKLGFTHEGIERQGEYLHGKYHDLEVYSLLKEEWKK